MASTFSTVLNNYDDNLTYWERALDTIYEIKDNYSKNVKYIIQKPKNNLLKIGLFIETENYVFFPACLYEGKLRKYMYNTDYIVFVC